MNIRDERQREAVEAYLATSDRRSIINACPRFGKIKVALEVMWKMLAGEVLILAPRNDIFKSWTDDFNKFGFVALIDFVTFTSIKKINPNKKYGLVIIDEPHEMSVNQQVSLAPFIKYTPTLGLTGTLTQKTRIELYDNLNLDVCYKYTIDQGVEDGILTDYQLFIHHVDLDDVEFQYGARKQYTEKDWFDISLRLRKEGKEEKDPKKMRVMDLRMISVIQNSLAKKDETIKLLSQYKDDRILVFCGVTKIADDLGIPVYHSKAKEKTIFDNFCTGIGMHLATIKMMQAGITVNPINKGIVNYISGNPEDSAQKICRFLGYEYNNPNKTAEIHIISTTEPFETERLKTGLLFFDQLKIKTCV